MPGTWIGHFVPGTCFVVWSTFQALSASFRYYRSCLRRTNDYSNSLCPYGLPISARKLSIISTSLVSFGVTMETSAYIYGHVHANLQHITMYSLFMSTLILQLIQTKGKKLALPQADSVTLWLAFTGESVLFVFHLHGRPPVDAHYHRLLLYTVLLCSLMAALEISANISNIWVFLARCYAVMLQGFWFITVGNLLHGPYHCGEIFQGDDDRNIKIATFLFVSVVIGTFWYVYMVLAVVRHRVMKEEMMGYAAKVHEGTMGSVELVDKDEEMEL